MAFPWELAAGTRCFAQLAIADVAVGAGFMEFVDVAGVGNEANLRHGFVSASSFRELWFFFLFPAFERAKGRFCALHLDATPGGNRSCRGGCQLRACVIAVL